ncbi:MAG TPA: RNA methyltransferase [Armatimonadota bacterium]|nr:RNA methyltransferase [Armatimonadota bacterium]
MIASFEPISGVKHPALRRARALATPAGRARAQHFLIEGESMLRQALAAKVGVTDAFLLADAEVETSLVEALTQARCYVLPRSLMTKILGTGYDTAITAAAVVPMRPAPIEALAAGGGPLLVCERVQDPRNVGVLLRTAEAGGAHGAVLSADGADPFSRAAVRSTTGSILRLPFAISRDLATDLGRLREAGLRIIATSARGRTPIALAHLDRDCAIIVGNESEGLSLETRRLADDTVAIPVAGGASSLNVTVAAGILLHECLRGAATED